MEHKAPQFTRNIRPRQYDRIMDALRNPIKPEEKGIRHYGA